MTWLTTPQLAAWVRLAGILELLPGILDTQLRRDADITHFDYYVLSTLSESESHKLRMTELAQLTNATLPRLSHVTQRLEARGLLERRPCPEDRRATDAHLTPVGMALLEQSAPGHVATVRKYVVDALTDEQITQLTAIGDALLERMDPDRKLAGVYHRYDA